MHFIAPPLLHCPSLLSAMLYNALHQYFMPLHSSASLYFSALHQHNTSLYSAVLNTALYFIVLHQHCTPLQFLYGAVPTLYFTSTSLHCTSVQSTVHFTMQHRIITYFTALQSLPRDGSHMYLHCDHDDSQ